VHLFGLEYGLQGAEFQFSEFFNCYVVLHDFHSSEGLMELSLQLIVVTATWQLEEPDMPTA
jgi:hypothetical protein